MTSSLATLDQIREHVETGLPDAALNRIVAAADADIQKAAGPHDGERSVEVNGGCQDIFLPSPATSIASVTEGSYFDAALETVDANDYVSLYGGRVLRRNGTWGIRVTVTYTPETTNAKRLEALLQLTALSVDYGPESFSDGSYSQKARDYASEKRRILAGVQYAYTMVA